MISLSYSTMNDLYNHPHSWLNKMMGVKKPDMPYFKKGRAIHDLIQDHFAGKVLDERVAKITDREFPIVEQQQQDPRCKITIPISDKYEVIGYFDGYNPETKERLEIKTSGSKFWSIGEYRKSIQRKIYALGMPEAERSFLITTLQDLELWDRQPPKTIAMKVQPNDYKEAMEYIEGAIKIIEAGDFTSDLVDGKCVSFCPHGYNCKFK